MVSLRFPYLNIDENTYMKKRKSYESIFTVLFSKPSLGHRKLIKMYKEVGIQPVRTVRYNKAPLSTLRSLNCLAKVLDESFYFTRLTNDSKRLLTKRKNLKYYLAINNLPRNGQRTRNNGKTAKRLGFHNVTRANYRPRRKRVKKMKEH